MKKESATNLLMQYMSRFFYLSKRFANCGRGSETFRFYADISTTTIMKRTVGFKNQTMFGGIISHIVLNSVFPMISECTCVSRLAKQNGELRKIIRRWLLFFTALRVLCNCDVKNVFES